MSALTDSISWSDVDRSSCGKFGLKFVFRTSPLKVKERFWERGWFLTNPNQVTSPSESMQTLWCFSKDAYIRCIYSWTQERFSFCYQGSYSCSGCRDGYVGDPYNECVPIKYCSEDRNSNPCGEGAECIPKKGGVHYECRVSICLCLKSVFHADFFLFRSRIESCLVVTSLTNHQSSWLFWKKIAQRSHPIRGKGCDLFERVSRA